MLDTNPMIDKSSLSIEFDKKIEAKFGLAALQKITSAANQRVNKSNLS
jgi:hypothetical protein